MDEETVCPHCGEARETPHVAVLEDDPYCDECWDKMCEAMGREYLGEVPPPAETSGGR